nr:hypothetical protein [Angustibacter aerolatus]
MAQCGHGEHDAAHAAAHLADPDLRHHRARGVGGGHLDRRRPPPVDVRGPRSRLRPAGQRAARPRRRGRRARRDLHVEQRGAPRACTSPCQAPVPCCTP